MIEINLLPEELRKKEPRFKNLGLPSIDLGSLDLKKVPLKTIAFGAAATLVLLHLCLFLAGLRSAAAANDVARKSAAILPQKNEAESLKNELDLISKKVKAIDGLMVKRFGWARKLNSLSDALTPGIWFTEVSYYEKSGEKTVETRSEQGDNRKKGAAKLISEKVIYKYLVISGYASSMGEQGTALIGKFIKSLKDSADFYSDFSEIKLDSIKSDKYMDQEVMNFKITCLFKGQNKREES